MSFISPIPPDEAERLIRLDQFAILDTPSEVGFEAIVNLAQHMFGCAIALVSLVDRDRQWFKARCGLEESEGAREHAFCGHAILQPDVFVVEDALEDARFCDNPSVTGEPHVRFYAGAPLFSMKPGTGNGSAIGTVCIADTRPRTFSTKDRMALRLLAGLVEDMLDARVTAAAMRQSSIEIQARAAIVERKNRHLRQTERMAGVGSWRLDLNTKIVEWSEQVFAIHELRSGKRPTFEEALSYYPEPERHRVAAHVQHAIDTGAAFDFECELITARGNRRRIRAVGELEILQGAPAALIGAIQDVTERHEHERSLEASANTDSLTELPNRRAFHSALRQFFEPMRSAMNAALCLVDVDCFKGVNDKHGHAIGDALLQEVARRLKAGAPDGAIVARLGGDEFAITMRGVGVDELGSITRAIVEAVHHPFQNGGAWILPSVSVGASSIRWASTPELLLKQADAALYRAKNAGRNQASVFAPSLAPTRNDQGDLLDEVKAGLKAGAFEAHYQPVVNLHTHQVSALEALIRWRHPSGRLLLPGSFFLALADPETSVLIDEFMMATGLDQLRRWLDAGVPVTRIGVNISDTKLRDPALVPSITRAVQERNLTPDRLKLEVLETAFVGRSPEQVATAIDQLARHGIVCALDDFGTGHASLIHLKQFKVERIKLDRAFVANLGTSSYDEAIVRCMIALCRDLAIGVTAEGIETADQLRMLRDMGCECGQGYLIGRPMSAAAVPGFLSRWHGGGSQRLLGRLDPSALSANLAGGDHPSPSHAVSPTGGRRRRDRIVDWSNDGRCLEPSATSCQ